MPSPVKGALRSALGPSGGRVVLSWPSSVGPLQSTSGQHLELIKDGVLLKVPWERTIFKICAEYLLTRSHFLKGEGEINEIRVN